MAERESRLFESHQSLDITTLTDTSESALTRFRAYTAYESCNISLSRLAIEALVHSNLRAEVFVQFIHEKLFKKLQGSVYLMLVRDICDASLSCKLDDAVASFQALIISSFPGENISKFANEV